MSVWQQAFFSFELHGFKVRRREKLLSEVRRQNIIIAASFSLHLHPIFWVHDEIIKQHRKQRDEISHNGGDPALTQQCLAIQLPAQSDPHNPAPNKEGFALRSMLCAPAEPEGNKNNNIKVHRAKEGAIRIGIRIFHEEEEQGMVAVCRWVSFKGVRLEGGHVGCFVWDARRQGRYGSLWPLLRQGFLRCGFCGRAFGSTQPENCKHQHY